MNRAERAAWLRQYHYVARMDNGVTVCYDTSPGVTAHLIARGGAWRVRCSMRNDCPRCNPYTHARNAPDTSFSAEAPTLDSVRVGGDAGVKVSQWVRYQVGRDLTKELLAGGS